MPDISRPRIYAGALVLGVLLLPGVAIAIGGPASDAEPEETAAFAVPIADVIHVDMADDADLAAACGHEGAGLVERASDGTASALELAALDALRPICANAGMPLAETATTAANLAAAAPVTPRSSGGNPPPGTQAPTTQAPTTQPDTGPTTTESPTTTEGPTTTTESPTTTDASTTTTEPDDSTTSTSVYEDDDDDDDDDADQPPADDGETQWVLGTYTAVGGTAGIEFAGAQARVAFATANAGYEKEVQYEDGPKILIFFKSDDHDSLIVATYDGSWKVNIVEADDF